MCATRVTLRPHTPVSERFLRSQVSRHHGLRAMMCRHLSVRQKLACALLLWWREAFVYLAFQVQFGTCVRLTNTYHSYLCL